jgi:hypothetical protein
MRYFSLVNPFQFCGSIAWLFRVIHGADWKQSVQRDLSQSHHSFSLSIGSSLAWNSVYCDPGGVAPSVQEPFLRICRESVCQYHDAACIAPTPDPHRFARV